MKKRLLIAIVLSILFGFHSIPMVPKAMALPLQKEIKVLLVYNSNYLKDANHILAAYESVLQEEGIPFESMECRQLIATPVDDLVGRVPAIILPDNLLQTVPEDFKIWIEKYLEKGGNIAVIYDVGVRNENGAFKDRSDFADLIGLNYITYSTSGVAAYDMGHVKFTSEANREFFQIPFGKTLDSLTLSSYNYGALQYPIARNEKVRDVPESSIYAYGITANKEQFPLVVMNDYAKGKVIYVNLPLGYLKAYSDDLPLRAILRTFLFDVIEIPHIMNVEQGRGGLVINWHVDSDIEHIALPFLLKNGYMRKEIAASFHITAGDFFLKPGDDTGFDADGAGKHLILQLKNYGIIGSHGGWAHNWFSQNIVNGVFKEKEIREYIAKNNECLEKIVGYKITEYAAPNGAHPQPAATKALEDLGMIAYYYTGDTGSAPNRVFYDGKMVSDKVIAFPLMPFGKTASIWEMKAIGKKQESEVKEWFYSTLDYVASNRTVRMIYSHPYDIQNYPQTIKEFLDKVIVMQSNGEIAVHPMSYFAEFFLRFLKTTYSFSCEGKQLVIYLNNPDGLSGITVALPKREFIKPVADDIMLQQDDRYYYVTVVGANEKEKYIKVDYH